MPPEPPTFADVLAARRRIAPHLPPTALNRYPALDELVGTEVWVKHENHQPVGAFKVRGGVNLVSRLSDDERQRGLIAASTGNHGQSIAYAARLFGVRATICVPEGANPVKVASMEGLGADVVFHGRDFDEAREHCEELAEKHGYRYVHSGDEPDLIAGVATGPLEALEREPGLDVLIVPIGGGSGAAGACIVADAVRPELEVIGVQSDAAPAAYRSWREGHVVEDEMRTSAEGLATRIGFELPQRILRERLENVIFYDQLGCGRSWLEADPSTWTVELYVEEVGAVRDALGLDRFHLFGSSWGGMLAMEHALTKPAGLASLVLSSSPASIPVWAEETNRLRRELPAEVQRVLDEEEAAGRIDSPEYQEATMEFYKRHVCRLDPWPDYVVRSFAGLREHPDVYMTMQGPNEFVITGTLKDWDITGRLGQITVPTLITAGEHDEFTPRQADALHRGIPGSKLVTFENCSHMQFAEEPERYRRLVVGFLESVEG